MHLAFMTWRDIARSRRDPVLTSPLSNRNDGFQRLPIQQHISTIAADLSSGRTRLENPIILGVTEKNPLFVIIDGQQRLLACEKIDYQEKIPVIINTYKTDDQMASAFLTINASRPLPPALLDELRTVIGPADGPTTSHLQQAREIIRLLNDKEDSPLYQDIAFYQTSGRIRSRAMRDAINQSLRNGFLYKIARSTPDTTALYTATASALKAIINAYPDEWNGHTAKSSRLIHGAGIRASFTALDTISLTLDTTDVTIISGRLALTAPHCAWTSGHWNTPDGPVPWNHIQNTPSDISILCAAMTRLSMAACI